MKKKMIKKKVLEKRESMPKELRNSILMMISRDPKLSRACVVCGKMPT